LGDGLKPDDSEPDARRELEGAGSDAGSPRRLRVALGMYAVLGLLVWFTMGAGRVLVQGRPVELRLVPLIVIGGLALRTVVAHQAEKIRRERGTPGGK
jgi:hypothetical protein